MRSRNPGSQRRALLQGVFEDNQKLVGPPVSKQRKTTVWWSMGISLLVIVIGLMVVGVEEDGTAEPVNSVEILTSPDQRILASQDELVASESTTDVPLSRVYGLGVNTIVLDPGHGGHDPGALGPVGLSEKTVTLDVALRLARRLKSRGYNVVLTRRQDVSVSLQQRVLDARDHEADLFVSIHVNSVPVDTLAFIETYYYSPRGDARAEALALRENVNSGYSVAQWRNSLESLGRTVRDEDSRRLATHIQNAMVSTMRKINPRIRDWGTRSGPFMVLVYTKVPAVLAEITAISMPEEEQNLLEDDYREQLAIGLESGIISYLSAEDSPVITAD
ncbi:MAG: N-acetylmuramoyl-L-alanine amidase [Rhodothermaceae bacterium]|nr:N-acetylmuramoyl-L-alanine amidase [Rhodothermaceae bacterium]